MEAFLACELFGVTFYFKVTNFNKKTHRQLKLLTLHNDL